MMFCLNSWINLKLLPDCINSKMYTFFHISVFLKSNVSYSLLSSTIYIIALCKIILVLIMGGPLLCIKYTNFFIIIHLLVIFERIKKNLLGEFYSKIVWLPLQDSIQTFFLPKIYRNFLSSIRK